MVAFATSVPELFIGLSSALQDIPSLSLGNIMGANLANLTLVVGVAVLLAGSIRSDSKISSQNFWLIFLISLLPVLLATDGVISRGDGIILLVVFALYIAKIFRDKEHFSKKLVEHNHRGLRSERHIFRHLSHFVGGTAILLVSAFLLIWSAREIVVEYFSSQYLLFGAVFLAIGTTLPEFVFATRSIQVGQP